MRSRVVTLQRMVKIKVWSTDVEVLEDFVSKVVDIAKKSGVKMSGPIHYPLRRSQLERLNYHTEREKRNTRSGK
jgi:small subunit ribosomal protein S10